MNGLEELGRVLAGAGRQETRTRPSSRPPPNGAKKLMFRGAALRPFGILGIVKIREACMSKQRK